MPSEPTNPAQFISLLERMLENDPKYAALLEELKKKIAEPWTLPAVSFQEHREQPTTITLPNGIKIEFPFKLPADYYEEKQVPPYYRIKFDEAGLPLLDEEGNNVFETDENGDPITLPQIATHWDYIERHPLNQPTVQFFSPIQKLLLNLRFGVNETNVEVVRIRLQTLLQIGELTGTSLGQRLQGGQNFSLYHSQVLELVRFITESHWDYFPNAKLGLEVLCQLLELEFQTHEGTTLQDDFVKLILKHLAATEYHTLSEEFIQWINTNI